MSGRGATGNEAAGTSSRGVRTLPRPCPTCPWRIDRSAADIPGYSAALAHDLAATCVQDLDADMTACHQAPFERGRTYPCAGWLAVVGANHLRVRIAVAFGRIPASALEPGDQWPALHASFDEMLNKLDSDGAALRAELDASPEACESDPAADDGSAANLRNAAAHVGEAVGHVEADR